MSIKEYWSELSPSDISGWTDMMLTLEKCAFNVRLTQCGLNQSVLNPLEGDPFVVYLEKQLKFREGIMLWKILKVSQNNAHARLTGSFLAVLEQNKNEIEPRKYAEEIQRINAEKEKFNIFRKLMFSKGFKHPGAALTNGAMNKRANFFL